MIFERICDRVQREMSVSTPPADGPLGDSPFQGRQARMARHLAGCAECAAYAARLRELDARLAQWKRETDIARVPREVESRIVAWIGEGLRDHRASALLALPLVQERRKRTMNQMSLALVMVAVAGAVIAPLLVHTHPARAESAMGRVVTAAEQAQNAHVTTWRTDDHGVLRVEEEMWYEAGRWRKEGRYGSRLIVAGPDYPRYDARSKSTIYGTYYRYDSGKQAVISMQEMGKQPTHFTLDALFPDHAQHTATDFGEETIGGRTIGKYQLDGTDTSRTLLWVDLATHLPVRFESATRGENANASDAWVTTVRVEYEFDRPLPDSLFDPSTLKDEGWRSR